MSPDRRAVLGGMLAMAGGKAADPQVPGGNHPMRPDQALNATHHTRPLPPGAQSGLIRAQIIIVSGGAGSGVFVYRAGTKPALGNQPIVSITSGTKDPFGNTVSPGIELFGESVAQLFSLSTGESGQTSTGGLLAGGTGIPGTTRQLVTQLFSPALNSGNAAALQLTSQSADGTVPASAIFGEALTVNGSLTVGLGPGTIWIPPSGDTTGAADPARIANALALYGNVGLLPGQWYFASGVTLGTAGQQVTGGGPQTVINDVGGFTGTALFYPAANNVTLAGFAVATSVASFIDYQNANILYFTGRDLIATGGTGAADLITNFNIHRSEFVRCQLTQNNPGKSVLTMGSTGSGMSTTTWRGCKFIATCGPGTGGIADNRTVPAINLIVPGNKNMDVLAFEDCWFNNAKNGTNLDNGQYFVSIACSAGLPNQDEDRVYFVNCSGNQVLGGFIQLQSIVGAVLDKPSVGNVFSVTTPSGVKQTAASFINVGTFPAGQHSQAISVRDYEREGAANLTPGSNPSDMQFSSDTVNVLVENPHVPDSGGSIQVDTGGCADFNLVAANTNLTFVTAPGTGSVQANGVLTEYKASGGVGFSVNGGTGQMITAAGLSPNISGSFTSSTDVATVTTVGPVSLGHRSVPANDPVTGSRYHITAWGTYSTGAGAPAGATFGLYWGGIAGTLVNSISPAAVAAGQAGQTWSLEADVWWSTVSAGTGTANVRLILDWAAGGTNARNVTIASAAGLVTNAAENLTIAFGWGSVPGGQSLAVLPVFVARAA